MSSSVLEKARDYENRFIESIKSEERPAFHISAPIGWINDPNGFSCFINIIHMVQCGGQCIGGIVNQKI